MTDLGTVKVRQQAGPLGVQEAVELTNAQIPYRNMAGDKNVAARAVKLVNQLSTIYEGAIRPLLARWRVIDAMMSGNAIERQSSDTQMPELYKTREAAVPRIAGMVMGNGPGPWFRAQPHKPANKMVAQANEALLTWQLKQARFRSLIDPLAEDLWTYQVCAVKVQWERRFLDKIRRTVETKVEGDGVVTSIKRKRSREVVYDGPAIRQINPYRLLVDPRVSRVQDMGFVGDQSDWRMEDLRQFEELGLFTNLDDVEKSQNEMPASGGTGLSDWARWGQDPTARYYAGLQAGNPKQAQKIQVIEVWTRFDLYGDGVERECCLTVANKKVCLRAIENPLDNKRRPYAVCRAARGGHAFFGVGPLDNAVRLQLDYNRYAAFAMRIASLMANPITFVEDDADLPNSLHLLPEGAILKGVGNVTMTRMPNTLDMIAFIFQHYERQIAEVTGVPKILEASPTGGTATEVLRLSQEGNRRLAGLARRFGEFCTDVLELMHGYNQQFLIAKTTFPVVGKNQQFLSGFAEVGPDTLLEGVDFEIVGADNMEMYGTRATALQNIAASMAPFIQVNAANFDTLEMLHEVVDANLGTEIADRLVNVPKDLEALMPQEHENELLAQGLTVPVDQEDDDQEHLMRMLPLLHNIGNYPTETQKKIMLHAELHKRQGLQKEEQQKVLAQRQAAQRAAMPQQAGGDAGPDGAAPVTGGPEQPGGQNQGENPGPTRKPTRAGRDASPSQEEASE